jgi:hypothetical protein
MRLGEETPMASKSNRQRPHASPGSEFREAAREKQPSLVAEFALFILENKKWWLIPILLVLGLVGLLVVFGSSGAAPFIYTLI